VLQAGVVDGGGGEAVVGGFGGDGVLPGYRT
jgi:hypothetical protein